MSKNKVGNSVSTPDKKKLNRRNFIKRSAAIGVGTAAFGTASTGPTQAQAITWDYEADVVVLGAGATGLPAAIRARDLGASVIVVEQNFDIGGTMIHSNGNVSLGGGDAIQVRDLAGKKDPEGLITIDPVEPPEALRDDPDLLFRDQTDWSVVNTGGKAHTGITTGKSCVRGPTTWPRSDNSSWTTTSNSRASTAPTITADCPARDGRRGCSRWRLSPTSKRER